MKKILGSLVVLSFIFSVLVTSYMTNAAVPEIYIAVNNGANPGEYEAVVSVRGNPGVSAYNLGIGFNNTVITPLSIREGDAFTSGMVFISNITGASETTIADLDVVTAVWGSARDDSSDGVLYTVLFRADPNATGRTELALYSRGANNAEGYFVDFILTGAVIQFSGGIQLPIILTAIGIIILIILATIVIIVRKQAQNKCLRPQTIPETPNFDDFGQSDQGNPSTHEA